MWIQQLGKYKYWFWYWHYVCEFMCFLLTTCSTDAPLLIMIASLKSGRSKRKKKSFMKLKCIHVHVKVSMCARGKTCEYLLFSWCKCKSGPDIPTTSPEGNPGSTSSHNWNIEKKTNKQKQQGAQWWAPAIMNRVKWQPPTKKLKPSDLMTTLFGLRAKRSTSSMEIWSTLLYTCKWYELYNEREETQSKYNSFLCLNWSTKMFTHGCKTFWKTFFGLQFPKGLKKVPGFDHYWHTYRQGM